MATENIVLPPAGKVTLISIWIETLLYGINCVVYGLCMFVLLRERGKISNRWVLVLTSTILFLLCTAHVGLSLQQLLEAYAYAPPGVPNYADMYFLTFTSSIRTQQNAVFIPLMFVQDLVLIWRLYVVFNHDWRAIVFPVILEAATIATAIAGAVIFSHPVQNSTQLLSISLSSCSLNLVVNVLVTTAIAARLWWMGRVVSSIRSDHSTSNPYASSIWVIVESGAIFAAVIVVQLAFYVTQTDDGALPLAYINATAQLAVLTPLLIVVRVGLGLTHSLPRAYQSAIMSRAPMTDMSFRAGPVEHAVELSHISSHLHTFSDDVKV